jgi:hypothetical protein
LSGEGIFPGEQARTFFEVAMSEVFHSVVIDGKTYHLPFIEEIPFDEQQDAEFGDSIKLAGKVEVPIVVWKERRTADSETVVDGAHRTIWVFRLGLPTPPIQVRSFKSEAEALEYVYLVNYRRRHLTKQELDDERKERIARVAEARVAGQSTRAIAEQEKISQPQVLRDLQKAGDTGGVSPGSKPNTEEEIPPSPPPKVTGKDGKTYNATQPQVPLFCPKCTRVGPVKDCKECARLAEERGRKPRAKRAPSQNGKAIATVKDLETHLGHARAVLDKLARQYGLAEEGKPIRGDAAYKEIEKQFKALFSGVEKWVKSHAKAKAK